MMLLHELGNPPPVRCRVRPRSIGVVLVGLLVLGCTPDAPEERLQDAGDRLDDAASRLAALNDEIAELESALDSKRSERRKLRARKQTLEERVAARATDVALFRAVQSALLEHDELSESAVSVDVDDGSVTLRGVVASAEERNAAVAAARDVPGADAIIVRLQIDETRDRRHAGNDEN